MAANYDPDDWQRVATAWREAVDDGMHHLRTLRDQPVWRPLPDSVRNTLETAVPTDPIPIERTLEQFFNDLLPYSNGNAHPSFFGWVHGGGNVYGAIGEMCAAIMNSNTGGRDHAAVYVERQVLQWCREIFHFPGQSSGLLTSGTSMATLTALTVARNEACEMDVNEQGLQRMTAQLVGYCSGQAHSSVLKAVQVLGLGANALRAVPFNDDFTMDVGALEAMIDSDRQKGLQPFCVVATAGTVNTGAIEDIEGVAALCKDKSIWLHVDAAFGGFAILLDEYRERLASMAQADSIVFDFHKLLQVPYSVGCLLVQDAEAHQRTFGTRREYLLTAEEGLAGGAPWFCDFGPELSRGFLALKVWFTIRSIGIRGITEVIRKQYGLAQYLSECVESHPKLELMAPVVTNIVCLRFKAVEPEAINETNKDIVTRLQLSGTAAPSTTTLRGALVIRVAIVNHRTEMQDMDSLVEQVVAVGEGMTC